MNARSSIFVMIVATLSLSACNKNDSAALLPHLEDDRDEAAHSSEKAKDNVATLRQEINGLRDDLAAIRVATDEVQTQARKAASDQQSIAYEMAQYQTRYLEGVQKRAPGTLLGDVNINAHIYRNARVKSVDSWDVSIIHDNGITKLAIADLSPDLQAKVGFNPNAGPRPAAPDKRLPTSSAAKASDQTPNGSSASSPSAPVVPMGSLKPGTVLQEGGGLSASGKILHRVVVGQDGRASELVGDGATATSPGKIQGAGSPLPPGYKPIGSGYSGSALDREYQKKAAGKP